MASLTVQVCATMLEERDLKLDLLALALLALVPCLVALLFEDFGFALRSGAAAKTRR